MRQMWFIAFADLQDCHLVNTTWLLSGAAAAPAAR
jgi:hypothetical protein